MTQKLQSQRSYKTSTVFLFVFSLKHFFKQVQVHVRENYDPAHLAFTKHRVKVFENFHPTNRKINLPTVLLIDRPISGKKRDVADL